MDGVDTSITNLQNSTTDNTNNIDVILNRYGSCNFANSKNTIIYDDDGIFTINDDGSITVNGTPTSNSYIIYKVTPYPYDVIIKGASIDNKVYLTAHPYSESWKSISDGDVIHGVATEAFAINIDAGVTVNNITVYPMLYDACFNLTEYVPATMTNRELTEMSQNIVFDKVFTNAIDNVIANSIRFMSGGFHTYIIIWASNYPANDSGTWLLIQSPIQQYITLPIISERNVTISSVNLSNRSIIFNQSSANVDTVRITIIQIS